MKKMKLKVNGGTTKYTNLRVLAWRLELSRRPIKVRGERASAAIDLSNAARCDGSRWPCPSSPRKALYLHIDHWVENDKGRYESARRKAEAIHGQNVIVPDAGEEYRRIDRAKVVIVHLPVPPAATV